MKVISYIVKKITTIPHSKKTDYRHQALQGYERSNLQTHLYIPIHKKVFRLLKIVCHGNRVIIISHRSLCEIYCFSRCLCFLVTPMCYIPFEWFLRQIKQSTCVIMYIFCVIIRNFCICVIMYMTRKRKRNAIGLRSKFLVQLALKL